MGGFSEKKPLKFIPSVHANFENAFVTSAAVVGGLRDTGSEKHGPFGFLREGSPSREPGPIRGDPGSGTSAF